MNNKKEMTIEDLAGMVKRGLDRIDERFDETATKKDIEGLESKITDISNKVNQIDKRLFSLEEDIYEKKRKQHDKLNERVRFIEQKLGIQTVR
jgi:uncharacterized protein YoxC